MLITNYTCGYDWLLLKSIELMKFLNLLKYFGFLSHRCRLGLVSSSACYQLQYFNQALDSLLLFSFVWFLFNVRADGTVIYPSLDELLQNFLNSVFHINLSISTFDGMYNETWLGISSQYIIYISVFSSLFWQVLGLETRYVLIPSLFR